MIHPLDVRFASVDIDRLPIQDAIDAMAAEVRHVYADHYNFSAAFESASGDLADLGDPRVTYHAKNVSARTVFSSMCQQVGWSYTFDVKHYIRFRNGPGLRETDNKVKR